MPRLFRLAIVRATEPGFVPTPALEAAVQALIIANDRTALRPGGDAALQYWTDVTSGHLQFQPTLLPWVTTAFRDGDAVGTPPGVPRSTILTRAWDALSARPDAPDLGDFDGLLVLLFPGASLSLRRADGSTASAPFEGGSCSFGRLTAAVVPVGHPAHTHSFITHELGHVIGLPDAQGIWRWTAEPTIEDPGAGYWSGGYGDPLDIMSAQAWVGGDPTTSGEPEPAWPLRDVRRRMGPAPSLALLHAQDRDNVPAASVQTWHAGDAPSRRFRLQPAYGDDGTRLLVVHPQRRAEPLPEDGLGRLYVEYRDRRGWDQGLGDGANDVLARSSVVVHLVAPLAGAAPQVAYRGSIAVPLDVDADVQVAGSPFTVRVTDVIQRSNAVMVEISRGLAPHFEIDEELRSSRERRPSGHLANGILAESRTPCGDRVRRVDWPTRTEARYTPLAWGHGGSGLLRFGDAPRHEAGSPDVQPALTLQWSLGGVALRQHRGVVEVPTPGGSVVVEYEVSRADRSLTVSSASGVAVDGLAARATLVDHVLGTTSTAERSFRAAGRYTGVHPHDIAALLRCTLRSTPRVFLPQDKRPRPMPRGHGGWDVGSWVAGLDARLKALEALGGPPPAELAAARELRTQLGWMLGGR